MASATATATAKLDPQLQAALRQIRSLAPYDKATAVQPDIPVRDGNRALVDISATVSEALRQHVTGLGGHLAPSPDPSRVVRAMLPLAALEALAARADVMAIVPADLQRVSRLQALPSAGSNP